MSLADLSLKRPTFITCIVISMLAIGYLSMKKLGVDLFPNVTFPVVTVTTPYLGAGPKEIETLVSKPLEDEVSSINGIKRLSSVNQEGVSVVIAEFNLETDIKYAEQQIRDRVGAAKKKLPKDASEPSIRSIDPADQPVVIFALKADTKSISPAELYDLANEVVRPRIEQVNKVGLVEVLGGRKREIQVALDRDKLKSYEVSASQIAARLGSSGEDIPVGKKSDGGKELVYRTLGQFTNLKDIAGSIVNFYGNDIPTTVSDVGQVLDTLKDERSRTYHNGTQSLFIYAFRQSGANTIAVVEDLKKKADQINLEIATLKGSPKIEVIRDGSIWIKANVTDVKESIFIGMALAIVVVLFFLGSWRSTLITSLALPNSLLGAFILMAFAGFTINIMTLLALSLSVGLLIDDAIVVRENIFRHLEMGKDPVKAASEGTAEVRLAVIATTLAVIAVFGPVGFLKGVVGQFFKEFGLTICFAMAISLFDALTIAPMLSAYFASKTHTLTSTKKSFNPLGPALRAFDRFQTRLEDVYVKIIGYSLRRPLVVLALSTVVFILSVSTVRFIPKTFLPQQDAGEFSVSLDMPPGTDLQKMDEVALHMDKILRENPEVATSALTVGNRDGEANVAEFYVKLVDSHSRKLNTTEFKAKVREQLKILAFTNPKVKDYDAVGGGLRPFTLNIVGQDQAELEIFGTKVYEELKKDKSLLDVELGFKPGKPEFQITPIKSRMEALGISTVGLGQELRTQIEGTVAAKYREAGVEYDIRVRLRDDQRKLEDTFSRTWIPNINNSLVRLPDVAKPVTTTGPTKITRQDRARYVRISADIAPGGGLGDVMNSLTEKFKSDPNLMLPKGVNFAFLGQAENFKELGEGMMTAMGLGMLFIFLVLASLYESFVTPLTIMLALPLAICGSFVALALANESLNIFSWIGMIMLMGLASKNSILLVDFANQLVARGKTRSEAMLIAGRTRLRPILMTTMALIAGTIPIALGLNEASRQRTSMGVGIIGGLVSSTLLTLVVVPAAYSYIDRFRVWSKTKMKQLFGVANLEA